MNHMTLMCSVKKERKNKTKTNFRKIPLPQTETTHSTFINKFLSNQFNISLNEKPSAYQLRRTYSSLAV